VGESPRSIFALAYGIAVQELRSCYDDLGIVAGRHHYDDYWTRDAAFAWLGALELGDGDVVGKHLAFLCSLQRKDGMIPFLVRKHLPGLSGLGVKIKISFRPKFRSHKALFLSEVIDSNPFFVIGLIGFLEKMRGDDVILNVFGTHLDRARQWCLEKVGEDGLVREGFLAGWNDGILKSGATLLNNVLFYRALDLWRETDTRFAETADRIKGALQRDFFNGRYFIDWIDRRPHDHFDSIANFLAVLWGVADLEQAEKILDFALERMFTPPFVRTAFPLYDPSRVELGNRIAGISGYWGGTMYWVEPACLFAMALAAAGRRTEALRVIEGLAELIVRHQGIYEVYEREKETAEFRPIRWRIFRSEYPFARSSGLYIFACHQLGIRY